MSLASARLICPLPSLGKGGKGAAPEALSRLWSGGRERSSPKSKIGRGMPRPCPRDFLYFLWYFCVFCGFSAAVETAPQSVGAALKAAPTPAAFRGASVPSNEIHNSQKFPSEAPPSFLTSRNTPHRLYEVNGFSAKNFPREDAARVLSNPATVKQLAAAL